MVNQQNAFVVDRTHLGSRAVAIKRIPEELFSNEALRPLPVEGFGASGTGKLNHAAKLCMIVPFRLKGLGYFLVDSATTSESHP